MNQQPAAPRSAPDTTKLVEQLNDADVVERQLHEHWEEYAVFQEKLTELRSSQDSLRGILRSVKAARSTSQGLDATLAVLIAGESGLEPGKDAWRDRIWALACDAVGEVLLNTALHSRATSTNAGLKRHSEWLLISIADNGLGGASIRLGGGLQRIQDRVRLAGGLFSLDSSAGTGTTVTIALPLIEPIGTPGSPDNPI